jgi:hypothetical protein
LIARDENVVLDLKGAWTGIEVEDHRAAAIGAGDRSKLRRDFTAVFSQAEVSGGKARGEMRTYRVAETPYAGGFRQP